MGKGVYPWEAPSPQPSPASREREMIQ
jgi:hypothetical protein